MTAGREDLLACEDGLERAIRQFRRCLPGWWFSVGECEVSCDASIAPTRQSADTALIPFDRRFDDGFHVDLPQPATLADALREAIIDAQDALFDARARAATPAQGEGDSHPPRVVA